MLRSKPTQASLSESEIRDALEDAANYLSKHQWCPSACYP